MGPGGAREMNEIFVDASFWIALRSDTQKDHRRALELGRSVTAARRVLVTSYLTFAEIHASFTRLPKLRRQVISDFTKSHVARILNPEIADYSSAFELLAQYDDKSFSFCDAVSFAMMRRLGLREALSFDHHFEQIGQFQILN
jgi:predicted nucleic acid-binding protein